MVPRIAVICDASGIVQHILAGAVRPGLAFRELAVDDGRAKLTQFLETIVRDGVAAGWELNLVLSHVGAPESVVCSGLRCGDQSCIVGHVSPDGFDEISRLNNELVNSQRELGRQKAALERANRELTDFAAVVSHDLRAPLRNIQQLIGLFQTKVPHLVDDRAAVWMQHIVMSAERLQKRIDDTLDYARLGGGPVPYERVRLNEVVDLLARPGLSRDDLPELPCVRWQIELLFQNLIENAFTYHGESPPAVHVGCQRHPGLYRISVRDNGRGIPAGHEAKVFEMFYQINPQSKGAGIGLATCQKIVQRHGGTLWAESKLGEGSTFYFTLPPAAEEAVRIGAAR